MVSWIRSIDRVLKGEATKPDALRSGTIDLPVGGLTVVLIILAALYGGCMGSFAVVARWGGAAASSGWLQLVYSAVKVPMLYFLTLLITFPSLYVFNALVGCRLDFGAILRLLIAALAVTLAVLASFGTIIVFFSLCTTSYPFMVLLNVLMFAIAGILGMSFLLQTLRRLAIVQSSVQMLAEAQTPVAEVLSGPTAPAQRSTSPSVRIVFAIWVLLFGLIGAQMGWVLRPFIGAPSAKVTFFRPRQGNFFEAVADRIAELAGESLPTNRSDWRAPTTEPGTGSGR